MPEPVYLEQVRGCHFKAKPVACRGCGAERKRAARKAPCLACGDTGKPVQRQGCARCGAGKLDHVHYGAPPSMNALGTGQHGTPFAYMALKTTWQAILTDLLAASGLPKGLDRVMAEGEATFPDAARRDQGNYRVLIEKALGDALTEGGWLEDDCWARYEFGNLTYRYERGVSATRLVLFPVVDSPAMILAVPDLGGVPDE